MRMAAAKQGDEIRGTDLHDVVVPGTPPTIVPLPHEFAGVLDGNLSSNVRINSKAAATVGSTATNRPHIPTSPGTAFTRAPANRGTVQAGSGSVLINSKPAARHGDPAMTCNDPADAPFGTVIASGNVRIG